MQLQLEGRARILGDDINTDYIISSRRKRDTLDPQILKTYLFEDIHPGLAISLRNGDMLVAGENFGCGSAMEVAVTVVLGAGIQAVVAKSFSRSYYRNAINNGLLPVECNTSGIGEGDQLTVLVGDTVSVHNKTTGETLVAQRMPDIMVAILAKGGLVPYFQQHHGFRV